ncbi:cytochrome c oxidase subunit 3 [Flavobacterium luminosum]|uniref:Cytochrome c oxidase subunit 3 n=1 Tax=Flavobacterium luminosum TaxID=2949086 RepID=A0ABT0TKS5_9FLAO|nr:cytochrome c oxidase subunit 3 [Flavobacterium sp. HXWNR70]MCL9808103.1 cytochrome c oxidase subunit 3 [Flavobacterium sp. HXWNR70]
MDLTIQEEKERKSRSAKLLLYFAMISMIMMFAGLTSAYLVSASRKDWTHEMHMPSAFTFSTLIILISSVTIHLALKSIRQNDRSKTSLYLWLTLLLAIGFVYTQFSGFGQLVDQGFFFTGSGSSITATFLYILALLHMAHLFGGVISLLIIIYNHYKQKYNASQTLGIELGAIFWHFLDILWIFLFLFLYFV